MKKMSHEEFSAACKAQFAGEDFDPINLACVCPMCGTIQSAESLIRAGVPFGRIGTVVGFSCVGRFTGAGDHKHREKPGRGCNWTLGGFLHIHKLVVVMSDGGEEPSFELATPAQARELRRLHRSDPDAITELSWKKKPGARRRSVRK